jgi:hypothetical protein
MQGAKHKAGALVVAHLAFREEHDDRPAFAMADSMEFQVQLAFGSPDTTGNIATFPGFHVEMRFEHHRYVGATSWNIHLRNTP